MSPSAPPAGAGTAERPLAGLRVVEFAQMIAAPSAALLLADYGAEVVKIEPPAGDGCRRLQSAASRARGVTPIFDAYNRGKRLITLDLANEADRREAEALLESADVLIEASRPGAMDRLGLGAAAVMERHPHLVYASVSGFGEGPIGRTRGGVDIVIQAESGMMALTGEAGGEPTRIGYTVVDAACGHALCHGILAALVQRGRTGRGAHVRISLYDVALQLQTGPIAEFQASGEQPVRSGNSSPLAAPADLFACGEGRIILTAYLEPHWRRLCEVIGAPELPEDARFATSAQRVANRDALRAAIEARLAAASAAEWTERIRAAGLLVGEVKDYAQVLADPVAIESALLVEPARGGGVLNPVRLGGPEKAA